MYCAVDMDINRAGDNNMKCTDYSKKWQQEVEEVGQVELKGT